MKTIEVQEQKVYVCAHCNGRTISLESETRKETSGRQKEFWGRLAGVLFYPLKGPGIFVLIFGGIFFLMLHVVSMIMLVGIFLGFIVGGYLIKYYVAVITHSANGERRPPGLDAIEFTGLANVMWTYIRAILVFILSFSPVLIYRIYVQSLGLRQAFFLLRDIEMDKNLYALVGISMFYFPSAFLAVAYFDSLDALNPGFVLVSIARAFGHYVVVVIGFLALTALEFGAGIMLKDMYIRHASVGNLFLIWIIARLISFYLTICLMHLLGVFLYCNKERMRW